jgi:glycosyltransferase involved in cell wall biosynthesis
MAFLDSHIANTDEPLVSIIVPAFNASKYVRECLDSLSNQTYRNLEILVMDDASEDTTLGIVRECASRDQRLVVHACRKNQGVSRVVNCLFQASKGQYVARVDADDVCSLDKTEKQVVFLRNNPDVVIVGGQVEFIDCDGSRVGEKRFPLNDQVLRDMLFTAMPIQQATCLLNRRLLPKDFLMYESEDRTAEEVDFYFRLLKYGKLANIPDLIYRYRMLQDSLSRHDPKETFRRTIAARKRAVKAHGYEPSMRAWTIHYMQIVTVAILPSKWVFPIYNTLRATLLRLYDSQHQAKGKRLQGK